MFCSIKLCQKQPDGNPNRPSSSHSNAEILQDPKVFSRLASLAHHGHGARTVLLTNGQFLTEKVGLAILDAEIGKIIIGFDGATKEVYESHRVRCNYERVLQNIKDFVHLRAQHVQKTRIEIKFVRTQRNAHEVRAAFELFKGLLDPSLDQFHDCLAVDWSDGIGEMAGVYLVERAAGKRLTSCNYFETGMQVQSDGKIGACCWDYNLNVSDGGIGNANENTLLGIFNSTKREALRQRLTDASTSPEKCNKCIIIHEAPQFDDAIMLAPNEFLEAKGPTSFLYRFE